jgi:hypothetical protein
MSAKSKVIDGVTFQVAPFMAVEALRLKVNLVKTFGPALGTLLGDSVTAREVKQNIAELNITGSALASGIMQLMNGLDEERFIALLKRLFATTVANWDQEGKNRAISFAGDNFETAMELVFTGRLFSVYSLVVFVLEVNYPDFFNKVVKGIGNRLTKIATSASAGPSSESESTALGM